LLRSVAFVTALTYQSNTDLLIKSQTCFGFRIPGTNLGLSFTYGFNKHSEKDLVSPSEAED